jgi:ubiquinone/menaquinone biosynthesis C-methylase UbiE
MRGAIVVLLALVVPRQEPAPRVPATMLNSHGASWLERSGREEEQRPSAIFEAMGLKDGDTVADLGCGTGWFARRMARVVGPHGKVYAVDIQPEMVDLARKLGKEEGLTNIEFVLDTATNPRLPAGGLDWILMVDVYHEFQEPRPMLQGIRAALKPGGRVALVEYRLEDSSVHVSAPHRMSVEQVLGEWLPAGFRLLQRLEFLPTQHFFIFEAGGQGESPSPPSN